MGPGDHVGSRVGAFHRRRRIGCVPGRRLDHDRVGQERRALRAGRELRGELAVAQVQRALAHDPGGGGIPEGGGAAVAEHHLVAVGQREQLPQAGADAPDQLLDRLLPVRGSHQRRTLAGEVRQLLGTQPRRTRSEPAVGGLELLRDL